MNIYDFYNMPIELDHWHKDDPDNKGIVEYRNKDGKIHREDKPAMVWVWPNGKEFWYKDGKKHREGGPAIIYPDGTKKWYKHGKIIEM